MSVLATEPISAYIHLCSTCGNCRIHASIPREFSYSTLWPIPQKS